MRCDRGSEFVNRNFKNLLKRWKIKLTITENEKKSNFAERALMTVKTRLTRLMSGRNTFKWADELENVIYSYNRTFHRSIGKSPVEVNEEHQAILWMKLYPNIIEKKNKIKRHNKEKGLRLVSIVGRLRAKIVHFSDKSVRIGTGVV